MSDTDKTGGRDINYWRRRMGLKEDGNVGVGSTSGNVGAPAGGSGGSSGNVGMGVTAPTPAAPTPAPPTRSPKRRASKPTVGNVGSSGNVGVGSTS